MQISFARIIGDVSAAIIIAAPVVASAYALNDPALIPVLQLMQQRLHTVSLSATSTAEREARSIFYGGFLIYDHVHEGLTDAEMGDDAITRLQTFLARDRVVYPEGRVTGIFDIATKDAVTLFQVTCHIDPPKGWVGDWYGCVGPRTRAAFRDGCFVRPVKIIPPPPPVSTQRCLISVTAANGQAPFNPLMSVTVNANARCDAQTFAVDLGDGSPIENISVPAGTCAPVTKTYTRTLSTVGDYTAKCGAENLTLATALYRVDPPPPTCQFAPSSIQAMCGSYAPVSWTSKNASRIYMPAAGDLPLSGDHNVFIIQPADILLHAYNSSGTTTCAVHVEASNYSGIPYGSSGAGDAQPYCALSANPSIVTDIKQPTTLSWTSGNATSAYIDGLGEVPVSGSTSTPLFTPTRKFSLTVRGPNGIGTCTAFAGMNAPPTCHLDVSLLNVVSGAATQLSWDTTNATRVFITNGLGHVGLKGSETLHPNQSINYELTAEGPAGRATCTQTVMVH